MSAKQRRTLKRFLRRAGLDRDQVTLHPDTWLRGAWLVQWGGVEPGVRLIMRNGGLAV